MNALKRFGIKPGTKFDIRSFDPANTAEFKDKEAAAAAVEANGRILAEMQVRLYAEDRRSLLIILQGMDTSGKDGTIRHVMTGMDPIGVSVVAFKAPSHEELDHDFLWRIHNVCPRKGEIAVFNRSHYEDVLIAKVRKLADAETIEARYRQINEFERHLTECGTTIVKLFLCISKDEQRERLKARLRDPLKNWKFEMGDLAERKLWDDYAQAYQTAVTRCGSEHAPWYVIPSDKKWFRNLAVSQCLVETLQRMNPKIPKPSRDWSKVKVV